MTNITNIEVRPGVRLRPWAWGDEASLVQHANNANVARYLRAVFPHPYTEADAREWLERRAGNSSTLNWAIDVEGDAVGSIGLRLDEGYPSAEIGYWLGESYWRRGIMTAAVAALARHAFGALRLEWLHAGVYEGNEASMAVLRANGFVADSGWTPAVDRSGTPIRAREHVLTRPQHAELTERPAGI